MSAESNVLTIPCPQCGAQMVIRLNGHTGQDFLGCVRFPDCRGTAQIPAYLAMVRAGATALPGFD